ncbi:glycoside hydrolase superfamily [Aspergillus flavus]|uniref:chitinase n=1 Tax=Aspergillus flavus TaxID=5059 RepID=A0A5N6GPV1_ASPFL|nr:glycoside hydrolase superfamily [Aspergillus flavus]
MIFPEGRKWHLLSLLFAYLAVQVLSQKCSGATSKQRYIGYYYPGHFEGRDCETLEPSDINVEPFTHLYLYGPHIRDKGPIAAPNNDIDRRRWKDFVNLKIKKPSLKTFISVTPYPLDSGNRVPFLLNAVGSFENRTDIIDSIVQVMDEFKFDGFNFAYTWRDLWQNDPKNSVLFLKELRALRNIDLPGMFEHLDHANFVSYDSSIDVACKDEEKWLSFPAALNIERSARLFQQANIDPNKLSPILVLGGQEWKLLDPKCKTPECPAETRPSRGKVTFESARSLKAKADLANENCLGGLAVEMVYTGGPATLANPNDLDPSNTSMKGAPPTNPLQDFDPNAHLTETDTPSTTSTQTASLSTDTSTTDTDTNVNTEGLSCHPAIGSVHVPIAQQDCDSNSTSTASHNPDTPVNAEEHTPSPTLAAPHEAGTSDEPNAMGPKPTLTLAHRIGTPTDTAEKANDEGTTPGEPANAP